ncbi:hypothetical protein Agub_g2009 [Astrephomene gubernaculifera]|uniref:DUF7781 domain-containing protein n=1 Tax=Astrephomene gubernaculifera TaxID=47775 RepID=A0AAD3DGF6_9CHLO|nr:hypothetical protein Agub_g2009 [Astrephomene gubernaculifera]
MSVVEDDDAASQGINSVIDEILDQYRFNWEPEHRIKFKKELAGFSLGVGLSKPHLAPARLRLTLKPPHAEETSSSSSKSSTSTSTSTTSSSTRSNRVAGWYGAPGRFVQKVLVLPQQRFAALYSRKLAWGFLRCQFVAGYFWDRRKASLDYRLSTKWNDGLRFKRKEYYQPTNHLLLRAKWNLDMQLPDVEGHLGGGEGSTQVPVDVEYGSLDFSVVQLDWVCDLDGFKDRRRHPPLPDLAAAASALSLPAALGGAGGGAKQAQGHAGAGAAAAAAAGKVPGSIPEPAPALAGRIAWPWQSG